MNGPDRDRKSASSCPYERPGRAAAGTSRTTSAPRTNNASSTPSTARRFPLTSDTCVWLTKSDMHVHDNWENDMRLHPARPSGPPSAISGTPSRRGLLGVLLVAQLMVILDISAVNVALPDMADDLGIRGTGSMGQAIAAVAGKGGHAVQLLGQADAGTPVTGDIVVLALPYPALADVVAHLGDLAGKIVVDITNPLDFETFDSLVVPADSSAAAEIAAELPSRGCSRRSTPPSPDARRRHRRPADHHRPDRRRRRRRQVHAGRHRTSGGLEAVDAGSLSGPASSRPSASCSSPSPPARRSPGPAASASSPDRPTTRHGLERTHA